MTCRRLRAAVRHRVQGHRVLLPGRQALPHPDRQGLRCDRQVCRGRDVLPPHQGALSLHRLRGAAPSFARPSLTTGLALVAALRQGRRRLQVPVRRPEVLLLPVRPHSPSRQKHPQRKRKAELVRKQGRQALPDAGQPRPPVHRGRRGRRQVRGRRGLLPAHQGAPNLLHQKHSHNRLSTRILQECVKVGAVCAPPAFETPVWV